MELHKNKRKYTIEELDRILVKIFGQPIIRIDLRDK